MRSHVTTRRYASPLFKAAVSALFVLTLLVTPMIHAQNLGTAPAFNQAVQGQQASAPEGAFKNLVDWIGNVICSGRRGIGDCWDSCGLARWARLPSLGVDSRRIVGGIRPNAIGRVLHHQCTTGRLSCRPLLQRFC